jgi:hypothetical protein
MAIALEEAHELRNLPREKGTRTFELRERAALPRHRAQRGEARRVGEADIVAHPRIAHISVVDVGARVESVDGLHQIEDDTEHVEIVAAGDQLGVRNRGTGQRRQHRDLAAHRVVTGGSGMLRRAAQHHRPAVDRQLHHDVLRPARERRDVGDGRSEPDPSDPGLQRLGVGIGQHHLDWHDRHSVRWAPTTVTISRGCGGPRWW